MKVADSITVGKQKSDKEKYKKFSDGSDLTLVDLFLFQCLESPKAIAVIDEEGTLAFSELDVKSKLLSDEFVSFGVRVNECIGIYVEPSMDMMIGTWGILRAGCAYLPLAPEYPDERVRYMIEDSKIKVIFTQAHLVKKLKELALADVIIVTLNDVKLKSNFEADSAKARTKRLVGSCLAYVIYTSGTTGKPKGVEIEHRSILNQLLWLNDEYKIDDKKTILRKTPMSFDAAQWEILSVALGAKIVMGKSGIYRDPSAMIEAVQKFKVSTIQCVPTLLQALVDEPEFVTCTTLSQIFSGGEALTRKLAKSCLDVMPGCSLINLYGPTECTINASAVTVDAKMVKAGPKVISIGFPVSNTSYYIVDGHEVVPTAEVGRVGELYIGGLQVARGYLNNPEHTAEKFIKLSVGHSKQKVRLYRTGDLASWNEDRSVQFVGRVDNQVKLRGYRVELDEIRVAIENHDWVKNAAAIIDSDSHTGFQTLIACLELNPREATLMDQGSHGAHHQSKEGRVQVKAQLSNLGLRSRAENAGKSVIVLPHKIASEKQRKQAFARKTYRFFEGEAICKKDIVELLEHQVIATESTCISDVSENVLGEILRTLGPFTSPERLLPKYAYASPGALYATQIYLEIHNVKGIVSGYYYFSPVDHELILIQSIEEVRTHGLTIHFMGKRSAIEAVYKNNVIEVLDMEAGHILGLLDCILPAYGLGIGSGHFTPNVRMFLDCSADHFYIGSYDVVPAAERRLGGTVELLVQTHADKVADLDEGQYRYSNGNFIKISSDLILKKHVIAINQQTYENSSFGVSIVSKVFDGWSGYIDLGRRLQQLQLNGNNIGLMSSGYSSKTGNDLLTAKRLNAILKDAGLDCGPSYFALAGRVSEEQILSEGMKEDAVHSKGPAEIIKQDLIGFLPEYMIPNKIIVLDKLPLSANGKINVQLLKSFVEGQRVKRTYVSPRSDMEKKVAQIWQDVMHCESLSMTDDFFEVGGNSLLAVVLINKINKVLNATLPLQTIFSAATVEALAMLLAENSFNKISRLIKLNVESSGSPIYCWPGLGGYPMNLRLLATSNGLSRPFFAVQALGINEGEVPYSTIKEMAAQDIQIIKAHQKHGPYTLWGYSFGARVSFEVANQLEQAGDVVDNLFLIAPGSPRTRQSSEGARDHSINRLDRDYLKILYSVFAGSILGPELAQCLDTVNTTEDFIAFVATRYPSLETSVVERIVKIVELTYEFKYTFKEMTEHAINSPITIFKAVGDDYSFLEANLGSLSATPQVFELGFDHYEVLKEAGVKNLAEAIASRMMQVEVVAPKISALP
ncbi:amino acid adenylation domain-containing protein [Pseudomonas sp. URMO17WK12:I11]|uniref:amino acid adenylation domain-containing protein n=1 Tax=Pseudomonas sp. URMO17WK12:I11 TaxID=1283291 RepID=UPI000722110D|nr:amino acid adenylation domain-containing protein [Pseudomonas sp. URMO17WK12:I11]CRL52045.1 Plipastatin synthase subunit C [Pseudomonas sp. URMO17WK12:I11]